MRTVKAEFVESATILASFDVLAVGAVHTYRGWECSHNYERALSDYIISSGSKFKLKCKEVSLQCVR